MGKDKKAKAKLYLAAYYWPDDDDCMSYARNKGYGIILPNGSDLMRLKVHIKAMGRWLTISFISELTYHQTELCPWLYIITYNNSCNNSSSCNNMSWSYMISEAHCTANLYRLRSSQRRNSGTARRLTFLLLFLSRRVDGYSDLNIAHRVSTQFLLHCRHSSAKRFTKGLSSLHECRTIYSQFGAEPSSYMVDLSRASQTSTIFLHDAGPGNMGPQQIW